MMKHENPPPPPPLPSPRPTPLLTPPRPQVRRKRGGTSDFQHELVAHYLNLAPTADAGGLQGLEIVAVTEADVENRCAPARAKRAQRRTSGSGAPTLSFSMRAKRAQGRTSGSAEPTPSFFMRERSERKEERAAVAHQHSSSFYMLASIAPPPLP
jgi:hypothetical protein